jgi:hypothetical protein
MPESKSKSAAPCDALVVGGGPAGLRAAELLSAAGLRTLLAEHKPSVGRKFLVAGRGGLNLTHSEPVENFPARYGDATQRWPSLLAEFSPDDLRLWAHGLGIETFVGTSGRIFPMTKQAAPLLRRWVERLRRQGVDFRVGHSLTGFRHAKNGVIEVEFNTPQGPATLTARVLILALGGASWPQTGSDGAWVNLLAATGIRVTPLVPANCGYEVDWPSEFLAQAEGLPLKNIELRAGNESVSGELLITCYGLEGGAIYQLGRALRTMTPPAIELDLKPAFTLERLVAKGNAAPAASPLEKAATAWRLSRAARALLRLRAPDGTIAELAALTKSFPLALKGPRPIQEAISSAGGIAWDELDDHLMLRRQPGIFCAGEMLDWEAPTGGYLLQGCLSTATRAARAAIAFLRR